ncbi:ATP-binding protein [Massilia sp. KIM]|uniref:hybrid sensor histidine kinase/response regulator n=1 Tax=Massilia sp. KIM TaxID=1955422 RepID=UPI001E484EED|nr:ATP-binding protein [Massilia sp. KIM]
MLLVAVAITPIAVMTVTGGLREREAAIQASKENLQRLANMAAANEAQLLERARQTLVDLTSVSDLMGSLEQCETLLRNVLERNDDYVNFGLIELNGDVSCSAAPLPYAVNLADRSHFRRAITERRFVASDYVFGRVVRRHTINLTYPVIDRAGKVVAAAFSALDLTSLDAFVKEITLPPGSILETVDSNGVIITRRPEPTRWFGKKVSSSLLRAMRNPTQQAVVFRGDDGIERLYTFARVGNAQLSDYTVIIGVPMQTITAAARDAQLLSLMGLAITTMLALLAAWLAGDILIVKRVRKLMEAARCIAAGQLEARSGIHYDDEEIGRLAEALDEMAATLQVKEAARNQAERELRAADKRKDDFLAMLAHELRNPLAPISTGAQLLKLLHSGNAQITQTSAIIARQVEHMTTLVDDLLDVSRVTRGLVAISVHMLDLRNVVEDAAEQVRPMVNARRHKMVLDLPEHVSAVRGDHKRLVQVVANILGNAAKYTPEGGHIMLRLANEVSVYTITITDDGIGMEASLVSKVFELFTQAERSPDRSQGGLGLGLALARSLVELHGGSVRATSAGLGRGSTFTIRLPRADEREEIRSHEIPLARPRPDPFNASHASLRILIVDDNVDAAYTLNVFLTAAQHSVQVAHSAAAALKIAEQFSPQVCLLDIGLPGINGNELARLLRKLPQTAGATLVAVTGYGAQHDRDAAEDAGFDHYMVKPVDTSALTSILYGRSIESES